MATRTTSEIGRILGVDRDVVKKWAYQFKKYLSPSANPASGEIRHFEDRDVPILAYVSEFWEDHPDIEHIKIGLNRGEYHEMTYFEPLYFSSRIFQEPPEGLDETWTHGILYCGSKAGEHLAVARAYKLAVETMIDAALESNEAHEYDYPILFLCRHTLELYLKRLGEVDKRTHDLKSCLHMIENKYKQPIRGMVRVWIEEFAEIDKEGTAFRYDDDEKPRYFELWVDLRQLKAAMRELCRMFEAVILKL